MLEYVSASRCPQAVLSANEEKPKYLPILGRL
jgi:hypothetical protein